MADKPKYLSRAEMEAVLKRGGSILHDGEVITEASKLPSEADLVGTDEKRREAALANMQDRKKNLEAEIAKLEAEPVVKPKEEPKAATPTPHAAPETEHPDRPHRPAHIPEEQAPQHGQRKLK